MAESHTTYQTRLYLSRNAHERMNEVSRMLNCFYNAALEERCEAWRLRRASRTPHTSTKFSARAPTRLWNPRDANA